MILDSSDKFIMGRGIEEQIRTGRDDNLFFESIKRNRITGILGKKDDAFADKGISKIPRFVDGSQGRERDSQVLCPAWFDNATFVENAGIDEIGADGNGIGFDVMADAFNQMGGLNQRGS